MKRVTVVLLLAMTLCAVTWAGIIPTSTLITGTGPFAWTYDLQLSTDQNVNSGVAPTTNPVPHSNLTFGGFFTIYDFAGYVAGSCSGPSGWTCTAQNVGFTPDDVVPTDNPNVLNITWVYTTGATLVGTGGLDLGLFSARSTINTPTLVSYAARGVENSGLQVGTIGDSVGETQGPASASSVPEPLTLLSTGLGLVLLRTRRKTRNSAR
jgi:hypothetical protein